jgi:hypothetical protein
MPAPEPPIGFDWSWVGDTARIDLPPFVETEHHAFEPVLTRLDAERIAAALASAPTWGEGPPRKPLARVFLQHDPRYARQTLSKFRDRLLAAFALEVLEPTVEFLAAGEPPPSRPTVPPASTSPSPSPSTKGPAAVPAVPPAGFDPAAETDHGFGLDESKPAAPSSEPPLREPSWRRRFEKKRS